MIKQVSPNQAWKVLTDNPGAVLIDVRSKVEYTHVGHPIGSVHIPWQEAPDWKINPHFVDQVIDSGADKTTPILLLCRSGRRSMAAAQALEMAGFTDLANIEEGFEGSLDEHRHRDTQSGWRFHELPWEQS